MFKQALITGASSGIGEQLAYLLASKNISLTLHGRDRQKLEEVAQKTGGEWIVADLRREEERKKILTFLSENTPDLVINNAGCGIYGDILSTSFEIQKEVIAVNLTASFEFTVEAARALQKAKKRGVILNVSSIAGEFPTPGMSTYGASKAFVTSFSRALNEETKRLGIDVLVVCPGMVTTSFSERALGRKISQEGPVMTAEFAAREIWRQIQKREEKRIINGKYRFISWVSRYFLPTSLIKKKIYKSIQARVDGK